MKTTVVFHRPFDGKVCLFLEDLELRTASILMKNLIPFFGVSCSSFYGRRKEDSSFLESRPFLPIILEEGCYYLGKDDLFFLLHNCLPDKAIVRNALLFYWRREDRLMGNLTLIPWRVGKQPCLMELPIGRETPG